jgi:hypothetical protein
MELPGKKNQRPIVDLFFVAENHRSNFTVLPHRWPNNFEDAATRTSLERFISGSPDKTGLRTAQHPCR